MDPQEVLFDPQVFHQTLKPASVRAMYSTFVIERATVECKVQCKLTGACDKVKTYPVADQRLSKSPT